MQEIYFWDHEEILEKSTTIVVYFDVGQQIRSREGREEKRGEIFRQVLSDFNQRGQKRVGGRQTTTTTFYDLLRPPTRSSIFSEFVSNRRAAINFIAIDTFITNYGNLQGSRRSSLVFILLIYNVSKCFSLSLFLSHYRSQSGISNPRSTRCKYSLSQLNQIAN